jgi:O-antigen/teichoic acid export membrane protein
VTDEDQSTDHHVGDGNDGTSLGTTAARGFLWANLGIVVRYGSGLVLAAVLARTLSPAAYAVMVTLMIVTFYFDNALDLGMGAALVYEQEKGISRRVQVAFTANVALAGILATVAFFGAPFIVDYFNLGGPSVAIATYDPKTGQFATPDGGVYRQTNLVAPSGERSWEDLLPTA